jgi:outer membrane lipoprotein
MRIIFLLVAALLLSACASMPEALVGSETVSEDFAQWQQNPDQAQQLRLSGVIARIDNLETQTRIEVVNLPIQSAGKPSLSVEADGRYVIYFDGYLEPLTYAQGRLLSVLGEANGTEKGMVGEYAYEFPVLHASGLHLWTIKEKVIIHEFPSSNLPCRTLYCRDFDSGTKSGHIVQQVE